MSKKRLFLNFYKKYLQKYFFLWAVLAVTLGVVYQHSVDQADGLAAKTPETDIEEFVSDARLPVEWNHINSLTLEPGQTLSTLLGKMQFDVRQIDDIVRKARKEIDLRSLRPGAILHAFASSGGETDIKKLELAIGKTKNLSMFRNEFQEWEAVLTKKEIEVRQKTFTGTIESNLWDASVKSGMPFLVISDLTEVFAWQIDFSRELRQGDRFRLLVEELFVDGEFLNFGKILAAEFMNSGELYQAFYFDGPTQAGYFAPDGSSLKKMFLKSPVKFSRISSRFTNRRFHPVLKRYKAHNGVDYAAAPGTPVRATGDGVVVYAGWRGAAGKHIQLRHNSTYQTGYSHLKGYAKGIKKGRRVKQGQIIGYVGATGRVTGPHLHFSFYENNVYVDPLGRKFPAANPLKKSYKQEFASRVNVYERSLPQWSAVEAM